MASVVAIVFTLKNNEKKDKAWGTPPKLMKNLVARKERYTDYE
jgi:hypothetical protein